MVVAYDICHKWRRDASAQMCIRASNIADGSGINEHDPSFCIIDALADIDFGIAIAIEIGKSDIGCCLLGSGCPQRRCAMNRQVVTIHVIVLGTYGKQDMPVVQLYYPVRGSIHCRNVTGYRKGMDDFMGLRVKHQYGIRIVIVVAWGGETNDFRSGIAIDIAHHGNQQSGNAHFRRPFFRDAPLESFWGIGTVRVLDIVRKCALGNNVFCRHGKNDDKKKETEKGAAE